MKKEDEDRLEDLAIKGAIGISLWLFVIKPGLKQIGIDPAAQEAVDKISSTTPKNNPFSPQYKYGPSSRGSQYTPSYYLAIKQKLDSNPDDTTVDQPWKTLNAVAADVYQGMKGFTVKTLFLNADFDQVMAGLHLLGDKAAISTLSAYMSAVYGVDLFTWLRDGEPLIPFLTSPNTGLSTNQLSQVITYVNSLPDQAGGSQ